MKKVKKHEKWINRRKQNDKKEKEYIITYPNGKEVKIKGLKKFCLKNNLRADCFHSLMIGKQKQHKGFKCRKIIERNEK